VGTGSTELGARNEVTSHGWRILDAGNLRSRICLGGWMSSEVVEGGA
jgi:hypothetical protein